MIRLFAALLILLSLVKVVMLVLRPERWLRLAKRLYARPIWLGAVSYLLAGLVLLGLLSSGLTMVQILAVSLFVVLLLIPGMASVAGDLLVILEKRGMAQLLREQWLYTTVWLALLGWGLLELLAG